MQAGGDVLGRCLTAKHVALEHLGQLITSYVGKVPVGGGSPQCLPAPSSAKPGHHPTHILSVHGSSHRVSALVLCRFCLKELGRTERQACMLRWGIMPSTAGGEGQGTVREPRCFEASGPGAGGGTVKADGH